MKLSIRKIDAIFVMKLQSIVRNMSIMVAPFMAIGFVVVMKSIMPEVDATEGGMHFSKDSFLLSFGLMFNIIMGGIMMSSHPLAEEKEKNTLRVLMTSSVNGAEFFIGSMLPSLMIMIIVNLLLIPVSGASFGSIHLGTYLTITTVGSLISILIGYIIGIYAKGQMQSSLIGMPILLSLTLAPMFRIFNPTLSKVVSYAYSGVISQFADQAFSGSGYQWNSKDIMVLIAWLAVSFGLFIYAYKKNGLDGE